MSSLVRNAHKLLRSRKCSAEDILKECVSTLHKSELVGWANPYITTLSTEQIFEQYEGLKSRKNEELPLFALPIAVKDNFCTKGILTTAGSKMLSNFVPTYNAAVVESLARAGAIITGKANMDEFAMGSTGMSSFFGPSKNPLGQKAFSESKDFYVPGGSSSGSAVAVALNTCFAAIGSDTGGSVRLPAAYCGLVGLKPSYGRVSRWGLIAYASSLDTPGIIANNVDDAALVLDAIAGPDVRDSTCIQEAYNPLLPAVLRCTDLKGVTIGIPQEFNVEELPEETLNAWREAVMYLQNQGATFTEVSIPTVKDALAAYYVIAISEASSNLARYDGVQYGFRSMDCKGRSLFDQYMETRTAGFGAEVKRRILTGSYVLSSSAYEECYERALFLRRRLTREFDDAFKKVDALLTPVSPFPVPLASDIRSETEGGIESYVVDCMTVPSSLAGLPSIAVPTFMQESKGIVTSMQIIAPYKREEVLLKVAKRLESGS